MYGTQAHHRANVTRDMIYSHQAAMYPQHQHFQQVQGMGQNMGGPGMVTIIHPQLGPTMVQQQPQMGMAQPQYQEYPPQNRHHQQQTQYIPTTSASRPHVQVMYANIDPMRTHMQGQPMQHSAPTHAPMGPQYHDDTNSSNSSGMSSRDVEQRPKGMVPFTDNFRNTYSPQRSLLKKSNMRLEGDSDAGRSEEDDTLEESGKKEEVNKKKVVAPSPFLPKESNAKRPESATGNELKEESDGNGSAPSLSETKTPSKLLGMVLDVSSHSNHEEVSPAELNTDGGLEGGEKARKRTADDSDAGSASERTSKKTMTMEI